MAPGWLPRGCPAGGNTTTRVRNAILVVVLMNAAIGAFQEGRAEQSLTALRKMSALKVRVCRAGRNSVIKARELVPGDITC